MSLVSSSFSSPTSTTPRWGRLSEGGVLPSILQHVSVPILSNEKCKSMFLKAGRHEVIPEIFMCAGYENGKMDSCQVSKTLFSIQIPLFD